MDDTGESEHEAVDSSDDNNPSSSSDSDPGWLVRSDDDDDTLSNGSGDGSGGDHGDFGGDPEGDPGHDGDDDSNDGSNDDDGNDGRPHEEPDGDDDPDPHFSSSSESDSDEGDENFSLDNPLLDQVFTSAENRTAREIIALVLALGCKQNLSYKTIIGICRILNVASDIEVLPGTKERL